jgi:hypothetical protein
MILKHFSLQFLHSSARKLLIVQHGARGTRTRRERESYCSGIPTFLVSVIAPTRPTPRQQRLWPVNWESSGGQSVACHCPDQFFPFCKYKAQSIENMLSTQGRYGLGKNRYPGTAPLYMMLVTELFKKDMILIIINNNPIL